MKYLENFDKLLIEFVKAFTTDEIRKHLKKLTKNNYNGKLNNTVLKQMYLLLRYQFLQQSKQDFLEADPYYDQSKIPLQTFKAKEPWMFPKSKAFKPFEADKSAFPYHSNTVFASPKNSAHNLTAEMTALFNTENKPYNDYFRPRNM